MGILTWIACLALLFYVTPFVRLVTRPLRSLIHGKKTQRVFPPSPILLKLGRWEYLLGPIRDRLLSVVLLAIVIYLWLTQKPMSQDTLLASSLIVFMNLLALVAIRYRDGIRLRLAELARVQSNIHPVDFFNLYYLMLSPWPSHFPESGYRLVDYTDADYRTGEPPKRTLWPVVESAVTTNTLARMAIMAFKRVGPKYGQDAFDGLARLWGSRVAQIFKARLKTTGAENIPLIHGRTLLLFNHRSYLDFALNFFGLGAIRMATLEEGLDSRHLRPRFIAAKDHFIDNPFIYSWISLGMVIENAGMIFVNRQKGKGWAAMTEAAEKLVSREVEIAVYPQGTRGYLLNSPTGERLDGGYYSTFSKKTWDMPLGHLKPGTAYLILDSLMQLKKKGEDKLNILVTGIHGTGRAAGKGNWYVQTETEVEFRVEPLWTLSTDMAEGVEKPAGPEAANPAEELYLKRIDQIQKQINQRLLGSLDWHRFLRERLTTELRNFHLPKPEIQAMEKLLDRAETSGNSLPFVLIDRIISLPPDLWERFFRLLVSIREEKESGPAWHALLQEVSERLVARR